MITREEAAAARAARLGGLKDRPSERRAADGAPKGATVIEFRAHAATKNDDGSFTVSGMASITERGYEMYDLFGPYTEIVSLDAFDKTLKSEPLVEFTLNHNKGGGLPMAHTRNGTLVLEARKDEGADTGLFYEANVDGRRSDVADMVMALERGDLAEASFKFRITAGQWSPDYTEYRIEEVDLHRGDVSAVNFGANPLASSSVREMPSIEEMRELVTAADKAAALRGVDLIDDYDVEHRSA